MNKQEKAAIANKKWYQKNREIILIKQKKYKQTKKGKLTQKKYQQSEKGRITSRKNAAKFQKTEKGKLGQRKFYQSEKGKINDRKKKAKRKRNLGWIQMFDNPFDELELVDWHHITDAYVIALPRDLHQLYGGKYHREKVMEIAKQIYLRE